MGISIDVTIGVISLLMGHFISVYITENLVTYFGVLVGAAVLASLVLQRYLAAASQLMSVIDTVRLPQTPTTIDSSGLCGTHARALQTKTLWMGRSRPTMVFP